MLKRAASASLSGQLQRGRFLKEMLSPLHLRLKETTPSLKRSSPARSAARTHPRNVSFLADESCPFFRQQFSQTEPKSLFRTLWEAYIPKIQKNTSDFACSCIFQQIVPKQTFPKKSCSYFILYQEICKYSPISGSAEGGGGIFP